MEKNFYVVGFSRCFFNLMKSDSMVKFTRHSLMIFLTIYHNFRGGILGWKIYTRESSREANPFGWKWTFLRNPSFQQPAEWYPKRYTVVGYHPVGQFPRKCRVTRANDLKQSGWGLFSTKRASVSANYPQIPPYASWFRACLRARR